MTVKELRRAMQYISPDTKVVIGQQESAITDTFPDIERAVVIQSLRNGKEELVLIEDNPLH